MRNKSALHQSFSDSDIIPWVATTRGQGCIFTHSISPPRKEMDRLSIMMSREADRLCPSGQYLGYCNLSFLTHYCRILFLGEGYRVSWKTSYLCQHHMASIVSPQKRNRKGFTLLVYAKVLSQPPLLRVCGT
jgi:hypothetical protein